MSGYKYVVGCEVGGEFFGQVRFGYIRVLAGQHSLPFGSQSLYAHAQFGYRAGKGEGQQVAMFLSCVEKDVIHNCLIVLG